MTNEQIEFATYCIDGLSRRLDLPQSEVYRMLDRSGILDGYIIEAYDVLHTFGGEYLMDDLVEYLQEKGLVA